MDDQGVPGTPVKDFFGLVEFPVEHEAISFPFQCVAEHSVEVGLVEAIMGFAFGRLFLVGVKGLEIPPDIGEDPGRFVEGGHEVPVILDGLFRSGPP